MRLRLALLASPVLACAVAHAADAPPPSNTVVKYIHPEHFVDAADSGFGGTASPVVLAEMTSVFQDLGAQYISAGEQLTLDVTDIDLAGRYQPGPNAGDWTRVMTDADWPRMSLHYTLTQDGKVLSQGDASISDMSYLSHAGKRSNSSDDKFYYERTMLDRWFKKTFASK
ncbi:DUF3016 domain-containing protein [Solimonas marina]|uniref:DUF3016 domain-containing protein n=1 Tax=Solimonas marina TaxID=2714601 RepID=A0A969WCA8_9GAMM|nr:DUF3016 domain-containing protein [Solimonas marina]NKF24572.1 DUF3016 domain-containing protein [Solimonas marina]